MELVPAGYFPVLFWQSNLGICDLAFPVAEDEEVAGTLTKIFKKTIVCIALILNSLRMKASTSPEIRKCTESNALNVDHSRS